MLRVPQNTFKGSRQLSVGANVRSVSIRQKPIPATSVQTAIFPAKRFGAPFAREGIRAGQIPRRMQAPWILSLCQLLPIRTSLPRISITHGRCTPFLPGTLDRIRSAPWVQSFAIFGIRAVLIFPMRRAPCFVQVPWCSRSSNMRLCLIQPDCHPTITNTYPTSTSVYIRSLKPIASKNPIYSLYNFCSTRVTSILGSMPANLWPQKLSPNSSAPSFNL